MILAATSPGIVFLLNAVSFVGVVLVLYRWERAPTEGGLPAEHAGSAMRAGLRYLRHAPDFQAVLIRTGLFVTSASAVWKPEAGRNGARVSRTWWTVWSAL